MRFGRFRVDCDRLVLEYDGEALPVAPKSVELLAVLIERSGDIVSKRELLDRLWPDSAVEEANLSQHVYVIRKTLRARDPNTREAIVTVPKRGYRFVPPPIEQVAPVVREPVPVRALTRPVAPPRAWAGLRRLAVAIVALVMMISTGATYAGHDPRRPKLGPEGIGAARLGRYYLDLRTSTGMARSRAYFTRVIASDPNSPIGYAGLADALTMTADYKFGTLPRATYLQRAASLARRAEALDPQSAEAHVALGNIAEHSNEMARAKEEFARAIALDRDYAPAHHWLGTLLFDEGDFSGSVRELTIASQLNPVSTATSVWLEIAAYFVHRYDTAIEHGRRAIELDPSRSDSLRELGLAYEAKGDYRSAIATFRSIPKTSEDSPRVPFLLAAVYAHAGHPEIARRIIGNERRRGMVDSELPFTLLALGESGEAARMATQVHFMDCQDRRLFAADPRFDGVRDDAAFNRVLNVSCAGHD